ncbi:hypothetical protein BKA69DRAFT_1121002 [Paraphysoderma sedebokerense]|nr:hypothetical protein BKA69DRAFT_1121002 [Paraphysoderma sedebokerense]
MAKKDIDERRREQQMNKTRTLEKLNWEDRIKTEVDKHSPNDLQNTIIGKDQSSKSKTDVS